MARIGYARVSTVEQNLDRQLVQLQDVGCDLIIKEKASGASLERPQLQKLLNELQEGDIVLVSDLTRITRSTQDLFTLLERIKQKGAGLKSLKDTWLDTSEENPYSTFLLTVMGGVNQLERDLLRQRQAEGIAIAKEKGKYVGRRPKYTESHKGMNHAIDLYKQEQGYTIKEICQITGVSESAFYRELRRRKEEGLI